MAATDHAVAGGIHPIDEVLPGGKLFVLGLQHVLVMYAGAVAVPLILGGALKLPKDQVALLINADLFACGVVTLIQSIGIWKFGIRMPVMMGVTFASVGPMIAIGTNPELGLLAIYGSVIASGIIGMLIAPIVSRMLPYFPPVVTGTIIAVIGITLMRVGINWAAGAPVSSIPGYGDPFHLGVALVVLVSILLIVRFAKGFLANIAVLLGIIIGFVIALSAGKVNFAGLEQAHWFDVIYPFQFGTPKFDVLSILTMTLVMIVVMIESTGMFLALGDLTEKKISREDLARGLRTDGLGTLIGGIFNTFPYTSFSQNVGLVGVTGVRSRWVTRGRRSDPPRIRPVPQNGASRRVGAAVRARRRRNRDVRDGRRDRDQDPGGSRLREAEGKPLHHRDQHRLWHDSPRGATVLPIDA